MISSIKEFAREGEVLRYHQSIRPACKIPYILLVGIGVFFSCMSEGVEARDKPVPDPDPAKNIQRKDAFGKPAKVPQFIRLSRAKNGELQSLDTSIVRYRQKNTANENTVVELVGVVHLGGAGYYQELGKRFEGYDSVLYELVAPDNARVPRRGAHKSGGAIGSAQQGLTKLLGLEFQLEQIDYTQKNFIHADLSPQEFDAAMKNRGESWWSMFMDIMQESMARPLKNQPEVSVSELFGAFFGNDREIRMRRILAEQFSDLEVLEKAFGGEDGSTLITDRNAAALEVLDSEQKRGQKKIAIFYGAAHMPDFDRRLREDFEMFPDESEWLEAWDLRLPDKKKAK